MKTMYLLLELTIIRILPRTFFFAEKFERMHIKSTSFLLLQCDLFFLTGKFPVLTELFYLSNKHEIVLKLQY